MFLLLFLSICLQNSLALCSQKPFELHKHVLAMQQDTLDQESMQLIKTARALREEKALKEEQRFLGYSTPEGIKKWIDAVIASTNLIPFLPITVNSPVKK